MSSWIEIQLKGGVKRKPMGNQRGPEKSLSGGSLKFELDKVGTWHLAAPFHPEWRYYLPDFPSGTWETKIGSELYLYGKDGKECFMIRDYKLLTGPAFYGLQGNKYEAATTWNRTTRPIKGNTGSWSGVAFKGSFGVGMQGEEVPCIITSWDTGEVVTFNLLSGRLGLTGGFSGGLALVIVTGFPDITQLNGYSVSGWDWALSFGAKIKGVTKLGKIGELMRELFSNINSVGKAIPIVKKSKKSADLISAGKGVVTTFGYDWMDKSVTVIDVPLAGVGAEIGIYLYYGSCFLVKKW